ncbi:ENR1 protein, partial [Pardalotus punctatus]|nr:ENR1 protein [Pardalotus punctatus]
YPTEQLYQRWDSKSQPYSVLPQIKKYWISASTTQPNFWEAPHELYWVCGKKAYSRLPSRWRGSCTLGAIQPSFFLLSEEAGNNLGIPL